MALIFVCVLISNVESCRDSYNYNNRIDALILQQLPFIFNLEIFPLNRIIISVSPSPLSECMNWNERNEPKQKQTQRWRSAQLWLRILKAICFQCDPRRWKYLNRLQHCYLLLQFVWTNSSTHLFYVHAISENCSPAHTQQQRKSSMNFFFIFTRNRLILRE